MNLNGLSILMFIFSFLTFLAGLYIYTGHNSELLIWKGHNKNATKKDLRLSGGWVMIVSGVILIIGIVGLFLDV